jgi:hypothetical protein
MFSEITIDVIYDDNSGDTKTYSGIAVLSNDDTKVFCEYKNLIKDWQDVCDYLESVYNVNSVAITYADRFHFYSADSGLPSPRYGRKLWGTL